MTEEEMVLVKKWWFDPTRMGRIGMFGLAIAGIPIAVRTIFGLGNADIVFRACELSGSFLGLGALFYSVTLFYLQWLGPLIYHIFVKRRKRE